MVKLRIATGVGLLLFMATMIGGPVRVSHAQDGGAVFFRGRVRSAIDYSISALRGNSHAKSNRWSGAGNDGFSPLPAMSGDSVGLSSRE